MCPDWDQRTRGRRRLKSIRYGTKNEDGLELNTKNLGVHEIWFGSHENLYRCKIERTTVWTWGCLTHESLHMVAFRHGRSGHRHVSSGMVRTYRLSIWALNLGKCLKKFQNHLDVQLSKMSYFLESGKQFLKAVKSNQRNKGRQKIIFLEKIFLEKYKCEFKNLFQHQGLFQLESLDTGNFERTKFWTCRCSNAR